MLCLLRAWCRGVPHRSSHIDGGFARTSALAFVPRLTLDVTVDFSTEMIDSARAGVEAPGHRIGGFS
jgi:hypothetical protein